jgi:hypothetical protein
VTPTRAEDALARAAGRGPRRRAAGSGSAGAGSGRRRARAARASVAAGRRARPSDLSPRVGTISLVLLTEIAETSDAVASTRARLAKAERLAACLRRLDPREVVVAAAFLSGELRQRQIGVGVAA